MSIDIRSLISNTDINLLQGSPKHEVKGICQDSRQLRPGDLFVAVSGQQSDGHKFIEGVVSKGCQALLLEKKESIPQNFKGVVLLSSNSRQVLGTLCHRFFGRPSEKLWMVGVTGTNGKTTTSHLVKLILENCGFRTGVIGTIGNEFGQKRSESSHTTPDALTLHSLLREWARTGAQAVSMEVSSHGLSLNRVEDVAFDVAIFTNLTRDHLDFHGTMENYLAAKAQLFHHVLKQSKKKSKRAIVNGEDPAGAQMVPSGIPTWTFGLHKGDFHAKDIKQSLDGTSFKLVSPSGVHDIKTSLVGLHNVLNLLPAIATGMHFGGKLSVIQEKIAIFSGVSGRLQRVPHSKFHIFVDYAHTPDALEKVVGFLKQMLQQTAKPHRLITVFGCGGDKDKGKRPLMLQAALAGSSQVVVTSDNPRTENPLDIISDILGERQLAQVHVEPDRKMAIKFAIEKAHAGDVILIAGKGHENYQIIGQDRIPFDDFQVAKEMVGT